MRIPDHFRERQKKHTRYLLRGELAVFLQKNRENSYKDFLKNKKITMFLLWYYL